MAFDNDLDEVCDSNLSCFSDDDDDIDDLYHELYDSLVKVTKDLKPKMAKNELLCHKIKQLKKENYDLNLLIE